MVDISNISFLLYFLYFGIVVFGAYYIPGSILLRRISLPALARISSAIILGMVLLGYEGYVFGYMGMRWLSYVVLFFFWGIWMLHFLEMLKKKKACLPAGREKHIRFIPDYVFIAIVVLGILAQLSTIFFTGVLKGGQAYYCCGDPNDNLWFSAITNQLVERIPPFQPGMYGVLFRNYHYWSNLIIAETSRLFHIPAFQLQFQYMAVLLSLLMGICIAGISQILQLGRSFARWLALFFYFGSDLTYLVLFTLGKKIDFTMSSLEDGVGFLANFPRAFGVIVCFGIIMLFLTYIKKNRWDVIVLLSLLVGSLVGFKIYIGIFVFAGFSAVALYELFFKKNIQIFSMFGMAGALALCIFLPMNSSSGGLFFSGLWRFENFAVQPALGLERWEFARVIFANDRKWHRVAVYEVLFALIYIVSSFGTKLIGLIQTKESLKKFPLPFHLFLIGGMGISAILGFFFMQTVGSSNTFNFLVSVFLFLSFYAALTCSTFIPKMPKVMRYIVIVLIVASLMPRIIYRVERNIREIQQNHGDRLEADVVGASEYFKRETPDGSLVAVDARPFFFDWNGPVFGAVTGRHMFYSGEGLLNGFQAPEKEKLERKKITKDIFENTSTIEVAKLLKLNHIDYLILSPSIPLASTTSAVFLEKVYEKDKVMIYKVNQEKIPIVIFLPLFKASP